MKKLLAVAAVVPLLGSCVATSAAIDAVKTQLDAFTAKTESDLAAFQEGSKSHDEVIDGLKASTETLSDSLEGVKNAAAEDASGLLGHGPLLDLGLTALLSALGVNVHRNRKYMVKKDTAA